MSYDLSLLDVPRLERYAKRVANQTHSKPETESPLGSHWELFSTNHHIEENGRKTSEYQELNKWVLASDGALHTIWEWENYTRLGPLGSPGKFERDTVVEPMSVAKILELDHIHPSYDRKSGGVHYWGNREKGRLVRHAPGVGLSLALKRLVEHS